MVLFRENITKLIVKKLNPLLLSEKKEGLIYKHIKTIKNYIVAISAFLPRCFFISR